MLNLAHDVMNVADLNRTRAIVLREYHLMKGPDNEAIFSVVCSSDILEQHRVIPCQITQNNRKFKPDRLGF